MKIGIVTLPLHSNYGGILQAWALQTVLERAGHEVQVVETDRFSVRVPTGVVALLRYVKRVLKNLLGRKCEIFIERNLSREREEIEKNTRRFVGKHINLRRYAAFSDVKEGEFDAFVVGSDQVWRPKYFEWMAGPLDDAFLRFTEGWNVRRVAYAASFGTDQWEYTDAQTRSCGRLAKNFDALSVRETHGVELIGKHFSCEARQVLDPTLLLTSDDYVRIMNDGTSVASGGNMMSYILDETESVTVAVEKLAQDKGMTLFRANAPVDNRELPLMRRVQPSVEQWLRGFSDAEYVVTDSFHACVFSILFRRQFAVIGNEERGMDRFHSLLSLFGLEERLVFDVARAADLPTIDYDRVYSVLDGLRESSLSFLVSNLSANE